MLQLNEMNSPEGGGGKWKSDHDGDFLVRLPTVANFL